MQFIKAPELKELVTFVPNRTEPIHNWYWYKEGFSRGLVDFLIDKFKIHQAHTVLDPFCGVGTTLLACKQRWIKSIGFDTSPLAVFVSKTKTMDYSLDQMDPILKEARLWKFQKPKSLPKDNFLRKAFSQYALEDLVFLKEKISKAENMQAKRLLGLALMDSAIKASYIYKDGSVAKIIKQKKPPMKILFRNKVKKMMKDLKRSNTPKISCSVEIGDARNLPIEDNSINFVITSPPYLNKIEYTNIYKLENFLFFDMPAEKLKSHIGDTPNTFEPAPKTGHLPLIAQSYFSDLKKVSNELFRVCKPGAKLAIVIGGGCFPDQAINSDMIFAEIAQSSGFLIQEILVAHESWCTAQRTRKIGKIRESIVILERT